MGATESADIFSYSLTIAWNKNPGSERNRAGVDSDNAMTHFRPRSRIRRQARVLWTVRRSRNINQPATATISFYRWRFIGSASRQRRISAIPAYPIYLKAISLLKLLNRLYRLWTADTIGLPVKYPCSINKFCTVFTAWPREPSFTRIDAAIATEVRHTRISVTTKERINCFFNKTTSRKQYLKHFFSIDKRCSLLTTPP